MAGCECEVGFGEGVVAGVRVGVGRGGEVGRSVAMGFHLVL